MLCGKRTLAQAPTNKAGEYLPYSEDQDWWCSNIDDEQKLQAADVGIASFTETPLTSLCTLFTRAAKVNGKKPALKIEQIETNTTSPATYVPLKKWNTLTWEEYYNKSEEFGLALQFLGQTKYDRTAIIAENHPYYAISFMGTVLSGGVSVPLDPDDTETDIFLKLNKIQPRIIVTDNAERLTTIRNNINHLNQVVQVITWGLPEAGNLTKQDGTEVVVISFENFLKHSANLKSDVLEKTKKDVVTQGCCAIVFTSGATDEAKAVMLSHDNFHYASVVNFRMMSNIGSKKKQYKFFSYLPLSVVSFLLYDIIAPIVLTANFTLKGWGTTHFARKTDLENGALLYRVRAVRPILFVGTPRVWTELMYAIEHGIVTRSSLFKNLLTRARTSAAKLNQAKKVGSNSSSPMFFWQKRFLRRLHKHFGLNKAQFLLCKHGAFPLKCSDFFDSLYLRVNEGYGMSETTGLGYMNSNYCFSPGSSGYEAPGIETKIVTSNDVLAEPCQDFYSPPLKSQGEILIRGRGIMMGYLDDDDGNNNSFDQSGFFHTGDIGTIDIRGMTKIIGKSSELVNGLSPEFAEFFLKQVCPKIYDAVIVSHDDKENIALLTLKSLQGEPTEEQVNEITSIIEMTNSTSEVMKSEAQNIKRFTILPRYFSVSTGELSSNLKLKRKNIMEIYEPIILAMYESEADGFYVPYTTAPTQDLARGSQAGINPWSITGGRSTIFSGQISKLS